MSSLPPWNGVALNLEPDGEDSNQYYDLMERPIWPKEGMACDVPDCSENKINNFTAYRRHWTKFHNEFIRKYKCDLCSSYSHVKRHMVTAHGHKVHGSPAVAEHGHRYGASYAKSSEVSIFIVQHLLKDANNDEI